LYYIPQSSSLKAFYDILGTDPLVYIERPEAESAKFSFDANELLLSALKSKPFLLLAGISGTGKSRKVQELAFATCPRDGKLDSDPTSPGNYCLIEVKPNWHDSTELLGYYSNLSGKYVLTDFIRFVYKAIQHPNVPFFVCLDEMNLAPVEQYFAEYLSVLETRKRIQNEQTGEYKIISAELITKESFHNVKLKSEVATPLERGDDVPQEYKDLYTGEDLQVVKYIKENGLRLPQNLFVIGTVNMDDTTHQFSRKVIDRAFTIEMNGGDLSSMFDAKDTLSYAETPLEAKYVIPSFAKAQEVLDAFPNDAETIKEKVPKLLDDVNGDGIFKDTPFRVSYRVENEMVLYFGSLRQFDSESSTETLINKAFLAILLEKILPRVEGDEKAMHCGTDGSSAILTSLQNLVDSFKPEDYNQGDGSLYDIISRKLHEMNERVKTSYFTSFFS
jgi:5-methylcytosine-specific restriction endonuclease McrBC GTP-binding regulatory subunit McrB